MKNIKDYIRRKMTVLRHKYLVCKHDLCELDNWDLLTDEQKSEVIKRWIELYEQDYDAER